MCHLWLLIALIQLVALIYNFHTAGVYQLCAQADVLQEIIELNENNNSSCQNINVATSTPDLEVISGSSGPQSICSPIV
jgi:subtilase family serine protease